MALSDNPRTKKSSPPVRAIDAKTNKAWSDKQKVEAVQTWLALGNLALTARMLGIPEVTLRVWKASEWWSSCVEDIRSSENVQLSAKLKKIVEASLLAVEDRIANGDWVFDQKSGTMIRKQVNMRDAHKVAVDLMDKKTVLDKTEKPAESEQRDDDRLLKLAEKFADFVSKKQKPVIEVTDVIEVKENNALHEEWETRLQDGIREVPLDSGTEEESQ